MKVSELLKAAKQNDSTLSEVKECHPKQIISTEINVPVWKIKYSYTTQRNNLKESIKYIFKDETSWEVIEVDFKSYINNFNELYPDRPISNVEILDTEYLGYLILQLE